MRLTNQRMAGAAMALTAAISKIDICPKRSACTPTALAKSADTTPIIAPASIHQKALIGKLGLLRCVAAYTSSSLFWHSFCTIFGTLAEARVPSRVVVVAEAPELKAA